MLFILFLCAIARLCYYEGKRQAFKEMDKEITNYEMEEIRRKRNY